MQMYPLYVELEKLATKIASTPHDSEYLRSEVYRIMRGITDAMLAAAVADVMSENMNFMCSITSLREKTGMGVKEAKEIIERARMWALDVSEEKKTKQPSAATLMYTDGFEAYDLYKEPVSGYSPLYDSSVVWPPAPAKTQVDVAEEAWKAFPHRVEVIPTFYELAQISSSVGVLKIKAIMFLRKQYALGLAESKNIVEGFLKLNPTVTITLGLKKTIELLTDKSKNLAEQLGEAQMLLVRASKSLAHTTNCLSSTLKTSTKFSTPVFEQSIAVAEDNVAKVSMYLAKFHTK